MRAKSASSVGADIQTGADPGLSRDVGLSGTVYPHKDFGDRIVHGVALGRGQDPTLRSFFSSEAL
jgi:hypothetical protein